MTREGLAQIDAEVTDAQKALAAAEDAGDRATARTSRDLRYWSARRGQPTWHLSRRTTEKFALAIPRRLSGTMAESRRIASSAKMKPTLPTDKIRLHRHLAQAPFGKRVGGPDVVFDGAAIAGKLARIDVAPSRRDFVAEVGAKAVKAARMIVSSLRRS